MLKKRCIPALLWSSVLLSTATFAGCSAHVSAGYRVYDPYAADYHVWGPGEDVYYHRWLGERHYDDRDFRRLNRDQQRDYWQWRHSQPEEHK